MCVCVCVRMCEGMHVGECMIVCMRMCVCVCSVCACVCVCVAGRCGGGKGEVWGVEQGREGQSRKRLQMISNMPKQQVWYCTRGERQQIHTP